MGTGLLVATPMLAEQKEPMNVIFILCDDLGYGDVGCYGQQRILTPNIDRMAAEGMQFTQHYAGCPVSAPSRCSLQTGLHTGHSQIRGNREIMPEGQEPLGAHTYTVARLMKDAGYATGLFGKWGLGTPGSESTPNKMGYDQFFGYLCQRQAHTYYPSHLWENERRVDFKENLNNAMKTYSQDLIHARAMKFIRENAGHPFFAMLTYTLPHAELNLPHDDVYRMYQKKFGEEKPFVSRGFVENHGGYNTSPAPHASFAAMVSRLDRYVGDIMTELKRLGIERNTLLVFTSDNGPHAEGGADPNFFKSSGPLRGIKRQVYEGGIRVPFVAWSPGNVPAGVKTDHMAAFWDFMPTMAELTGRKLGTYTDGISYLPTLLGKDGQRQHPFLYWEFHEEGGRQALRMGEWKLIRQPVNGQTRTELYHLPSDLHEDHNVAAEHPERVKEMMLVMENARTHSDWFDFGRERK